MLARIATKASCLLLLLVISFTTKAQLKADFSGTPLSGCSPLVVQFTDQSTGSPTNWRWDLGNGTISFLRNPSVIYFTPGQYNVKLVILKGNGADSIVKSQFVTVFAAPAIQFTSNVTTGCFPLDVQFTDQSGAGSGTITKWEWDFGDGNFSDQQHPLHTYLAGGNFNVTLRVTNSNGCIKTFSKSQYIKITAGVIADFSNSAPNTCKPPVIINFENLSAGTGILGHSWDFGDGTTSNLLNPSHTYTVPGSYTVQLITTTANGCADTISKENVISVGTVDASFTTNATACEKSTIAITNTSAPIPGSVFWDFGDGTTSTDINPTKAYATAGTYLVKMIADFGACTDSAFRTITIISKPVAQFTATDTISCTVPLTVNFVDQTTGGISYKWNFGDNDSSNLQNPSHIYTKKGKYNVTLIATNNAGCADTLNKINYIKLQSAGLKLNNLPDSGCVPFSKTFSAGIVTPGPITSYKWNFGDGNSSTDPIPTHTFTSEGSYNITCIITTAGGCTDTVTVSNGVIAGNKPIPNFNAAPTDVCAKLPVFFFDQTGGNITRWLWDFGDNSTSNKQNPNHKYVDTGYFDVKLTVWQKGCVDSIEFPKYIHVNPPIAKYSFTSTCKKPLERVFTDQSVGTDTWNWDFGDGATSSIKSPTHTYETAGNYLTTLIVFNTITGCSDTMVKNIVVTNMKAIFFASDTIICKGKNIVFTAPAQVNSGSYFWSFGNGATITTTTRSTSYSYSKAGTYTVRLITTDILGCKDTLIKTNYIQVDGPTAKFSSAVPGSCLNSSVSFIDSSISDGVHPIQSWSWNYDDGQIDTLSGGPYQHTYSSSGTYAVSLSVTDSKGCSNSYVLPTSLIISKPVADFISADTLSCPGKPIGFTNQSTGPNLTYTWDFGDGNSSTDQNPVHLFAADGNYNVTLSIVDQYGCTGSISKSNYVKIITPVADFHMSDSVSTCPPLMVNFTNLSGSAIKIEWDFGDSTTATINNPSHFYTYPGIYTVTLKATGPGGCTEIKQRQIIIRGPKGTFSYTPLHGCNPVKIDFIASPEQKSSFIWDFSDGTTIPTADSVISHIYTHPGAYVPRLILVDLNGCQVPVKGLDTINTYGVEAEFNFSTTPLCDSGSIAFIDSSFTTNVIATYNWDFGDGTSSTEKDPVHQYTAGLYYPKLTVTTQSGCTDTYASPDSVKVVVSPKIDLLPPADGCTPLAGIFKGQVLVPDTSVLTWKWDFGNGNTSDLKDPLVQTYTIAGIYQVEVTATNSSGCKGLITKPVEAYAIPNVNAGLDTMVCKGSGITLTALGADTYVWSPATGLNCINCASPLASPILQTTYSVIGTTFHGCSATDSIQLKVRLPFNITYSRPDTLCKGNATKLQADGAHSYQWSPETGLSDSKIAAPTASPDTSTTYQVIGTDEWGCFKDTGSVKIKVYPIPSVEAGEDKTINVGKTADLTAVVSNDVTDVSWSPTGDIFRNSVEGITVKPRQTTDYTVEVQNGGKCKARDKVTVFVVCNGSNVYIPNTFSPNGDGVNDAFYPRGTGLFTIRSLRIFGRWGEVIYENSNFKANDAAAGWNGTYKGAKLSSDVYVYTIEIVCDNNSALTYKGNIALIQ